jgi:hypothetical protein
MEITITTGVRRAIHKHSMFIDLKVPKPTIKTLMKIHTSKCHQLSCIHGPKQKEA